MTLEAFGELLHKAVIEKTPSEVGFTHTWHGFVVYFDCYLGFDILEK